MKAQQQRRREQGSNNLRQRNLEQGAQSWRWVPGCCKARNRLTVGVQAGANYETGPPGTGRVLWLSGCWGVLGLRVDDARAIVYFDRPHPGQRAQWGAEQGLTARGRRETTSQHQGREKKKTKLGRVLFFTAGARVGRFRVMNWTP